MFVDSVDLGDGASIVVRHVRKGDLEGLMAMYRRLAPEDLQMRFFTGGLPSRDVVRRWVMMEERPGGVGLVAEFVAPDSDPVIIGEAGCSPLPDGDAELGITVDPDHRGWFGACFLDTLLLEAASLGYRNVQALVASDNKKMRSLLCHRGAAAMPNQDWTTARFTMSTTGRTPSWPPGGDHERKRLLVESKRQRWPGTEEANKRGFDVIVCTGPDSKHGHCPLLEDERCPLIEGSDAVIVDFEPSSEGIPPVSALTNHADGTRDVVQQTDHSATAARAALDELMGSGLPLPLLPPDEDNT